MKRLTAGLGLLFLSGCFDPEPVESATTTGTASESESGTTSLSADNGGETTQGNVGSDGSSSGEDGEPDFGIGDPPDFGNLGPDGVGSVLVVHGLEADEIDVWVAGELEPRFSLMPRTANRLTNLEREAHRLVLTAHGTTDVVGCSEWFPLRAGEQWAVVALRSIHDCNDSSAQGASLTFEQSLPLDANPLRFVNGNISGEVTVTGDQQITVDALPSLTSAMSSELPNCDASGCTVGLELGLDEPELRRPFTILIDDLTEVPAKGEVMLIVLGDLRQDWPTEPNASILLRVDSDGRVFKIQRNPEVAFVRFDGVETEVSTTAPPSTIPLGTIVSDCYGGCEALTLGFLPREVPLQFSGDGTVLYENIVFEAGLRYVLVIGEHPEAETNQAFVFADDFDHDDTGVSLGRGFNLATANPLNIGRRFGTSGVVAFDNMQAIEAGQLSPLPAQPLPTGEGWTPVVSQGDAPLVDSGGFAIGLETPQGFRGWVIKTDGDDNYSGFHLLDLTLWPPTQDLIPIAIP